MRTLTLILALILVLATVGCSPMTRREQALFGLMVSAHAADYETTRSVLSRGGIEHNPLFGRRPDQGDLVVFKLGAVGVLWLLGELLPEHRETVYAWGAVAGGGAAVWNWEQSRR